MEKDIVFREAFKVVKKDFIENTHPEATYFNDRIGGVDYGEEEFKKKLKDWDSDHSYYSAIVKILEQSSDMNIFVCDLVRFVKFIESKNETIKMIELLSGRGQVLPLPNIGALDELFRKIDEEMRKQFGKDEDNNE